MISLIKNELIKLFSKRWIFISLLIIFLLIFVTSYYEGSKKEEKEKYTYQANLNSDLSTIENNKNNIEMLTYENIQNFIDKNFGRESWQWYVLTYGREEVREPLYNYIYMESCNQYIEEQKDNLEYYKIDPNELKENIDKDSAKEELDNLVKKFKTEDWKTIAKWLISLYQEDLLKLEEEKSQYTESDYKSSKESIEDNIKRLEIRLEKNINFGNNYLNDALDRIFGAKYDLEEIKEKEKKYGNSYQYDIDRQKAIENLAKGNYIIEAHYDIEKENTVRDRVSNIFNTHQIYIIIILILVTASIMSDEFIKNTITPLLIRPYSRTKIFLAKLLTCFIILLFLSILIPIMVLVSNVILFGINTLEIPMVMYNFITNNLIEMNMFEYLFIHFIAKLPMFVGVILIGFACGTVFKSSLISATISAITYLMYAFVIKISSDTIKLTSLLFTTNWDFSNYLFGKLSEYPVLNFKFSLTICLIYMIIIIFPAYIIFKYRDIKNN